MVRFGACIAIIVMTMITAMEVVSLALGTTAFPVMKATVHTWVAWLMWGVIAFCVLRLAKDLFFGLMTKLRLD